MANQNFLSYRVEEKEYIKFSLLCNHLNKKQSVLLREAVDLLKEKYSIEYELICTVVNSDEENQAEWVAKLICHAIDHDKNQEVKTILNE